MTPECGSISSSSYFIGNSIRFGTIPLKTLSNVLLPDPEGPSKSTFSLSLISIFKLSKILRSPLGYFRRKFSLLTL